jgi:hypothetical protein
VRDRLDELGDAAVVVVTFAAEERAGAYHRAVLAPLTVLVDTERAAYRAYGLERGSLRRIWGPKVWAEYARLLRRGRRLARVHEDTRQLGGDVIIDRTGCIALLHRSADPTDRPDIDLLVTTIRRL